MTQREAIYTVGFEHKNPIPAAARKGPFVFSGGFTGRDHHTGELPDLLEDQITNIFSHFRELMRTVGGTTDDILKVTFWVTDLHDHSALNRAWLAMFPHELNRPARQTLKRRYR